MSVFKNSYRIFCLLLLSSAKLFCYSDDLYIHLDDKLFIAQEEFEGLYLDLYRQGLFKLEDGKSIALMESVNLDILRSGPILLNLIEWLQEQNKKEIDVLKQALQKKLDRYLYILFRDFILNLKIKEPQGKHLIGLLHKFYKFKIPNKNKTTDILDKFEYPFRSTLSKSIIFILITQATDLSYCEKNKHVSYFLDKIRRELFDINRDLGKLKLLEAEIDDFVEFLQTYSIKKPLIWLNNFKFLFKAMAVIIVSIIMISIILYFSYPFLKDNLSKESKKAVEDAQARVLDGWEKFKSGCQEHWWGRRIFGDKKEICKQDDISVSVETKPGLLARFWNGIRHPIESFYGNKSSTPTN